MFKRLTILQGLIYLILLCATLLEIQTVQAFSDADNFPPKPKDKHGFDRKGHWEEGTFAVGRGGLGFDWAKTTAPFWAFLTDADGKEARCYGQYVSIHNTGRYPLYWGQEAALNMGVEPNQTILMHIVVYFTRKDPCIVHKLHFKWWIDD